MILTYQSIWLAIWHAKDAQEMQELLYLPGMRVQSEVVSHMTLSFLSCYCLRLTLL